MRSRLIICLRINSLFALQVTAFYYCLLSPFRLRRGLKEKISMEENTDGKKKTTPSIPANYISILQLQERWINEKEKKRKEEEEEEERRRRRQVEEEQKIEEDLKKVEEARGQVEEEKRLNRSNRRHWGREKHYMNGGGARFVEKEKQEVTAEIGSERGEDTVERLPEKNRGFRRKRYRSKKKKNQDVAVVEDVVDCGCVTIAPSKSVVTENVTPVKDVIRVYRKKREKAATGDQSVVTDAATALETQFEDLSIKRGETKNLKAQTKSSSCNRAKQGNDLAHQRVKMPIGAASTMVWVKKEIASDGIASGVKPLNA